MPPPSGQHLAKRARRLQAELDELKQASDIFTTGAAVEVPLLEGGATDNPNSVFPSKYWEPSPELQKALGNLQTARDIGANITYQPEKEIYKAQQDLNDAQNAAQWDQFILSKYDLQNPYDVQQVQKMFPDFFERRMKIVDEKLENYKKWARIEMLGLQSVDDLKFEYLRQGGIIKVDESTLEGIIHGPPDGRNEVSEHFSRGIMNPLGANTVPREGTFTPTRGAGVIEAGKAGAPGLNGIGDDWRRLEVTQRGNFVRKLFGQAPIEQDAQFRPNVGARVNNPFSANALARYGRPQSASLYGTAKERTPGRTTPQVRNATRVAGAALIAPLHGNAAAFGAAEG